MKRIDLLQALEIVKAGLTSEEGPVEQGTAFVFIKGRIYTYNDVVSISTSVDDLPEELSGAIHAKELMKLLGKLQSDEIQIEVNDAEVLMKSGRAKAGFTLQQEIKLPLDEIGERGKWMKLPEEFTKALGFTMTTCSRDASRPVLTCVNIRSDGRLESSDNLRISIYQIDKMPTKTFLLPAVAAQIITKYAVTHIAEGSGWAHFKAGAVEFACRVFDDNFPNVDSTLEVEGTAVELPIKTQEILDRAAVFCTQEQILDQKVTVTISEKRLKMRANGDTGWFEEETNMAYRGNQLSFVINPNLLKTILGQTQSCIAGERCLKFTQDKWQHVVALLAD